MDCFYLRPYNQPHTGSSAVASKSQRRPAGTHRGHPAGKRLVRVEVQTTRKDIGLIRAVAKTLRGDPEKAKALRSKLEEALVSPGARTAFDVFGTDLPDEAFKNVFDQPRQERWREVDL
jgi:hypothetical protein